MYPSNIAFVTCVPHCLTVRVCVGVWVCVGVCMARGLLVLPYGPSGILQYNNSSINMIVARDVPDWKSAWAYRNNDANGDDR